MKSSDGSGTAKFAREKAQGDVRKEKMAAMLAAHKVFILHRTVMEKDPKCLESFGKNCIVIPVVELQEVGKKATQGVIDFGAWKFIQNLVEYEKRGNFGKVFKTNSGATVILDSNGNNFENLSPGMEKNKENRIYLVAWNIINQLCENRKNQKGGSLREEEIEQIRKKVIIVSSETITRALGQQENLETQEYKSGNFISNINDLYTGMVELRIKASSEGMITMLAKDDRSGNKIKVIQDEAIAQHIKNLDLYPNQCCILKFEDKIKYAIYKKSQKIFRIVDQKPEENGEKVGPRNMEQCFFEALARDKSIALITVTGGAGTGKTVMVAKASLEMLERKSDMGVIVYRPIVGNGTDLGFLPGEYEEKINPYLQPVVSAFRYVSSDGKSSDASPPKGTIENDLFMKNGAGSKVDAYIASGRIRLESINFIQGTTNHDSWMFADEAQDFIQPEIEALTTRIGNRGKIFLTGDLRQIHRQFLQPTASGLVWLIENLKNSELTAQINFTEVFRHPLVEEISAISRF